MRPVTWKSGLAGLALTLGVGLVPSALLLAQSGEVYRVPEPVGVPVRRHRNPKQDGRPFSSDYQSAWQEHLAEEREAMTLERLHRSEPPTSRLARETAMESSQRKIAARQAQMRGQARPAYVVRRGLVDNRSTSLLGTEVARALPVGAGSSTNGTVPAGGNEPAGGTVTSVKVIAEYPTQPERTGLFARMFRKVTPYSRHTIVEPVESEELAASEGEMWAENENHAAAEVSEESAELAGAEGVPGTETEADSETVVVQMPESATQAVSITKESGPVPVSEAPRNLDVPLPVPDLPLESAATAVPATSMPEKSVAEPKVMPAHQTAQGPEKAKRTAWSAPSAPPVPSAPELAVQAATMGSGDSAHSPSDKATKVEPKEPESGRPAKNYALPTIPDEVLKKYKAR